MILLWCLFVSLVLGGWVLHKQAVAALAALRLRLFGVPVRVPARPAARVRRRRAALPSQWGQVPPPRVVTRPGGG
jgi:hypothetical protein